MKPTDRTPSELIDHIANLILERERKSLPTFYTISIEQYEKTTPVAEKEEGYENFKAQVLKYMSDYQLTSILIELFSGKSRNVNRPFQSFKVMLKKQSPNFTFAGLEKTNTTEVQQLDSSIPVSVHFTEKFEMQIRLMRAEYDAQRLAERMGELTDRYEDKLKDQQQRYEERIRTLEQDMREYETEFTKSEKEKHNSFGNIALGTVGARALEGFAKSATGQALLKGVLGDAGFQTLQGHLAGIEAEKNEQPEKSGARIISEPDPNDQRGVALAYIQEIAESLSDLHLRMIYDIAEVTEENTKDLEILWKVLQQMKQQRGKTSPTPPPVPPSANESTKEEDIN